MKYKSLTIGIILAALGVFIYSNKKTRSFFSNLGVNNQRTILASLETNKLHGPHPFKILKIKEGNKVWLEIYFVLKEASNPKQKLDLHKKISLKGQFDGHIQIREQASNLALANIDNDKALEILVPTYTRSMTPILNIFKYDSILEEFNRVNNNNYDPVF